MYDSNFDKYDEKKVYISDITNISSDLKDDMRVQINYVGDVMYELDGGVYSVPVKMQDISSTGMRFLCRISLAKELNYQIVMPWTVEPLIIEFNILRKMDTIGDKEFIYSYECKFIKINYLEGNMLKEGEFQVESLKCKNKNKSAEGNNIKGG